MHIGERIRELRQTRRVTKAELQRVTGIHRSTISLIEKGTIKHPSFEHVVKIAQALKVDPTDLVHCEGDRQANGPGRLTSDRANLALQEMATLPTADQEHMADVLKLLVDWHRVSAHGICFSTPEAQSLVMRLARLPKDEKRRTAKLLLWVMDLCEGATEQEVSRKLGLESPPVAD